MGKYISTVVLLLYSVQVGYNCCWLLLTTTLGKRRSNLTCKHDDDDDDFTFFLKVEVGVNVVFVVLCSVRYYLWHDKVQVGMTSFLGRALTFGECVRYTPSGRANRVIRPLLLTHETLIVYL
jgi:hypothetical protein